MKTKNLLRKAFLLLALMGVGNVAWAASVNDLVAISENYTFIADNITDNGNQKLTANTLYDKGHIFAPTANSVATNKGSSTIAGETHLNSLRLKNTQDQLCFKVSGACTVTFYTQSHGSRGIQVGSEAGGTQYGSQPVATTEWSCAIPSAGVVYLSSFSGDFYFAGFEVKFPTTPTISAPSTATINVTESGVEVTEDIDVTGKNLKGSTLTATLSPAVEGLSVTLGSNSITADGAITTKATLHYTQTVNANGSTTLTLSDGTTSKNVTVNYSASVVAWELQTISTAKTWDFSKLTGGVQYKDADLNVEHVYANIAEIGYKDESFDKTALAFTGEYALREGKSCAQNGTLRFNTSVPGYIVIKFSDTGTSASATAVKRYLVINNETTEYWASRENNGENPYAAQLNVTTDPIAVPAGDVTIKGTSALVYSKVEFTPVSSTVLKQITSAGWATLYTHCALDFSGVSGLTAYTATYNSSESTVTLNPVDDVPANTGVVLSGVADVYTIPVIASSETAKGDLKGSSFGCLTYDSEAAYDYYMLALNGAGEAQFTKLTSGTIAAGKAYLQLPKSAGARTLNVVIAGGETTGISDASRLNDNGEMKNDNFFNLNGQRVEKPTKGLYIKNGKKVIIK